jgi:parallel beta helix pectate lyase-like protein
MKTITLLLLLIPLLLSAKQLEVCIDCEYNSLSSASSVAIPGDTIFIIGTVISGDNVSELKGKPNNWIHIIGKDNATFDGGNTALQLSDCEYLYISNITFEKQRLNGVNIDDAGTYDSPTHHIKITNCTFRDMEGTGNNDLLKLSGFEDFEIMNCIFLNGSKGGSGIDMVGCHNGLIVNNYFENMGSNCIQAKGGTRDIEITRNIFINGGNRAVNIGGSTGLSYFRPQDSKTESQDISIYANIFVGGECAVAFVGTVNSHVYNNTIVGSRKWIFRILQETVDPDRFLLCGDNSFYNNVVQFDDSLSMTVNIGPNTRPESFLFYNNLWYKENNQSWNHNLPFDDINSIVGINPELSEKYGHDIYPRNSIVVEGKGKELSKPTYDYDSVEYATPPTIGAFEVNPISSIKRNKESDNMILRDGLLYIHDFEFNKYKIYNYSGILLGESETNNNSIKLDQINEKYLILLLESGRTRKVLILRK